MKLFVAVTDSDWFNYLSEQRIRINKRPMQIILIGTDHRIQYSVSVRRNGTWESVQRPEVPGDVQDSVEASQRRVAQAASKTVNEAFIRSEHNRHMIGACFLADLEVEVRAG
jgi:hypothetical protein